MSQFNTLSPAFRESLHRSFGQLADKDASCGGCGGGSIQGPSSKENAVNGIMDAIRRFDERILKDWLYSLDEESMSEVRRLFDEMNDISAMEFALLMKSSGACCPWRMIGDMFSPAAQEEATVIVEEAGPAAEPPGA
jgi:hypothetical protein